MVEKRNSILAGLAFGILFGIFLGIRFSINYAIIAGTISGLLFGIIMYFFSTSKIVKKQTEIETNGKPINHSGSANHFINGEAVGGKLYLMDNSIQFKSHNFNIQNHQQTIEIKDIKKVVFYNTLGLIPNGLEIILNNNNSEKFVVNDRKKWKSEIEHLIKNDS